MSWRKRAFWNGVRRGSRFGAIAGITIWLVVLVACIAMTLSIPVLREHAFAEIQEGNPLIALGNFLAPVLLMAIFGAVPGALIMGIAGAIRPDREEWPIRNG